MRTAADGLAYAFVHLSPMRRLFFLLLLFLPAALFPQDATHVAPLPTAEELLQRMVARAQHDQENDPDKTYAYKIHNVTDQLDADGKVKEHHDANFQMVLIEGEPFPRLVDKDGKPLSDNDKEKATKAEEKFRKRVLEKRKHPDKKDDDDGLIIDEKLIARFQFQPIRVEDVSGHPAYLLTMLPKPDQPPTRNMQEKIVSHLQGKIWIDVEDSELVKADVDLTEPVRVGGFLGSVKEVHLDVVEDRIAPSVWVPQTVHLRVNARALLKSIRLRQQSDFSDYRPYEH
jgi:hypothetical protein